MFDDDSRRYRVVRNDEDQYSLWPADAEPPPGWFAAGAAGSKAQCLEHIARVWTDMRPKSLREFMDAQ